MDMEINKVYPLLADAIMVIHFLFIAFVLGGQACIVVGNFRNWHWVHNLVFRACHLLSIVIVVAQAWASQLCPLTHWESALRETAGEHPYAETFVQHWVGRLIYYDAPAWLFTLAYTMFGALVLFSWFWVRPEKRAPNKPTGGDVLKDAPQP